MHYLLKCILSYSCLCCFLSLTGRSLQPKPANTPTPPRPQGQPSPSIVVQQPPAVYGQTVCFPQMYPLTPVSPGVQVRLATCRGSVASHLISPHVTSCHVISSQPRLSHWSCTNSSKRIRKLFGEPATFVSAFSWSPRLNTIISYQLQFLVMYLFLAFRNSKNKMMRDVAMCAGTSVWVLV